MAISGRGSKAKGSTYERDLAAHLRSHGIDAHRTPLSGGGASSYHFGGGQPDLLGTPLIWVEAKRTERLNVREAIIQAETAIAKTKSQEKPVVITRRNHEPLEDSLVVMRLKDWLPLYKSHLNPHISPLPAATMASDPV